MNARELPARAQVVVIGGGVVGAACAYHLAARGWTDVVLLEKNVLTSGTTWHAAGLITQARATDSTRRIVQRSLEDFKNLEADTGFATGFVECGTLQIATSTERLQELRHQLSVMRGSGIEVELLGPKETLERHPLINSVGVLGSLFYPRDGRGSATDTTISLARGASARGAVIREHTAALNVIIEKGRAAAVETESGRIECDYVVNATGQWGRQFAASHGLDLPLQALAHYYVVTEAIPGIQRDLPTVKSGDDYAYVKDEAGALMVGFFEPGSYPWASHGIPDDAGFIHLPEDWDHLGPFYEKIIERFPVLEDAAIRLHFCGPESFTPDGLYHLGPAPQVPNYFVAAGFNSVGFLSGPGAGSVLADWLVDGHPPLDLAETALTRVQEHETNRRFLERRVVETLDDAYEIHWPFQQKTSARGLRRSPFFEQTRDAGAVFGELVGWERANWYAPPGVEGAYEYSFGKPNWLPQSRLEQRAIRGNVGLIDISSFGKLLIQGKDALAVLQTLSVNDIDVEPGRIVYTQWLNDAGGIEADVTVTRTSDDSFLVLSGPATVRRDFDRLSQQLSFHDSATVTEVTNSYAMLAVMGPTSRELLQPLTDADLSSAAFPFGTSRMIDLGYGYVRATRITYVGELGWELLVPSDIASHIYETVADAGQECGLRHVGYHAMNALRIEKAYRSWGHDIGMLDNPLEAGLGFTVKWDKPGGFIGRNALEKARETGISRRLVQLLVQDPDHMLFHDEPVYRDGELVGRVASAMYGDTLGAVVALAWVHSPEAGTPAAWYEDGRYEIEVGGVRVDALPSLRPMYDPKSERTKA